MEIEPLLNRLLIVVFICIAIAFAYNVVRYRGVKGAMFGAPIHRTLGELELARSAMTTTVLRVHVLGGDASREIGLELVSKSLLSYRMTPFPLSRSDARVLARLLEDALVVRPLDPRDSAA